MSGIPIENINVLVHPDFSVIWQGAPIDQKQQELRRRWLEKAGALSKEEDSILLVYPASFLTSDRKDPHVRDYLAAEANRHRTFDELLGPRFFYFDVQLTPQMSGLTRQLRERGFVYHPDNVKLYVFGEYLEECVSTWKSNVGFTLMIPHSNRATLAELSKPDYTLSRNRKAKTI